MRNLFNRENNLIQVDFIPFSQCNNNCTFCFQKTTENIKVISEDSIISQFNVLKQFIIEKSESYKNFNIDINGGELFFMQKLFNSYKYVFNELNILKNKLNINIKCLIGTNLLYEDTGLLYNVLNYILDLNPALLRGMFTSFDFSGRFATLDAANLHTKNTLDLFDFLYKNKIHMSVSSVLSKDSMAQFISPTNEISRYLKKIYDYYYMMGKKYNDSRNNDYWFRLNWMQLSPNTLDEEYRNASIPTTDDIVVFYKYLADNYPEISSVKSFMSKDLILKCGNNCYVCKLGYIERSCDSNVYGKDLLISKNLKVPSNKPVDIYSYLMKKYNCLACGYFNTCYVRSCPVVVNLNIVDNADYCWRKKIYEYVNKKDN